MNGWLKENAQKPSEMTEKDVMDNQKPSNVMENESKTVTETEKPSFPNLMVQNVVIGTGTLVHSLGSMNPLTIELSQS